MAVAVNWTVDHACGHQADHDLSARPADRRAALARWLAERNCPTCWQATRQTDNADRRQEQRDQEHAAALAWARQFEMPPLDGSDKSAAWGERCRHHLVTSAYTTLVTEGEMSEADWRPLEDAARTLTAASWWIDQRDADPADLPELLHAATATDTTGEPSATPRPAVPPAPYHSGGASYHGNPAGPSR